MATGSDEVANTSQTARTRIKMRPAASLATQQLGRTERSMTLFVFMGFGGRIPGGTDDDSAIMRNLSSPVQLEMLPLTEGSAKANITESTHSSRGGSLAETRFGPGPA